MYNPDRRIAFRIFNYDFHKTNKSAEIGGRDARDDNHFYNYCDNDPYNSWVQ